LPVIFGDDVKAVQVMTAGPGGPTLGRRLQLPGEVPGCLQVSLPCAAQAVGLARAVVRQVLASWKMACVGEDAGLVASELVTNAVRHAHGHGGEIGLLLEAGEAWLRIEVHDADPLPPRPRVPAAFDESGFGFIIIEALAGKWGVREMAGGKAVWAELDTSRSPPSEEDNEGEAVNYPAAAG
jgi:serine/threonine-protein kinase RsbW